MSLLTSIAPSLARHSGRTAARNSFPASSPAVRPAYEVRETPEAYRVTVALPGLANDGLELTADNAEIRIEGKRAWNRPEGWTTLYRESPDAPFRLVLAHQNAVDVDHIAADLKDGVLTVSLPKAEDLKPRKIAVQ